MAGLQAAAPARRRVHLGRLLIGALLIVVLGAGATLFGWDVNGWFKQIWKTLTSIPLGYLLAALVLITVQTVTTAYAWFSILRYAYPDSAVKWIEVLACYAAVALNFVLPANLGTLAMMIMFTTTIVAATFAGVLAAYVVQKVFYTTIGIAGYVYLFTT